MGEASATYRPAARVIVVDPQDRVLLFRIADGLRPPIWITPGGGVEGGEDLAEAAVRELREETGLEVGLEELGSPVATCRGEWVFRGTRYLSHDAFFWLRTDTFEPDDAGWTALEREVHDSWRWCTTGDFEPLDGVVLPGGLADLVAGIASGRRPATPVVLPWLAV